MSSITKFLASILAFLQFIFCGISYGDFGETKNEEKQETEIVNNIDSHTNMAESVKFAHQVKNQAQAKYTTPERTAYEFKNSNMILTHSLTKNNSATLTDLEGNVYIADSFDTYFTTNNGKTYYSSSSSDMGRVNIIRLGVYYYDCHVRDFDGNSKDFKVDKTYHLYGDRLYNQSTLYACEETTDLQEFGSIIKIPADTVSSFVAKDDGGVYQNTTGETPSLHYVAFDIKNVGVVGFIAPYDGSVKSTSLTLEDGYYVLKFVANYTAGTGINKHDETGSSPLNNVTFGTRIYTDKTHSFDGIDKEAYLERNPLAGITVDASDAGARFLGYDALRGAYTFTMNGTDFTTAYNNPERQYKAPITITSDDKDRTFYIRMFGLTVALKQVQFLTTKTHLFPLTLKYAKTSRVTVENLSTA